MDDNKNWKIFKEQVQDALDIEGFKEVNDSMSKSVTSALSDAKAQIQKTAEDVRKVGESLRKDLNFKYEYDSRDEYIKEDKHNNQKKPEIIINTTKKDMTVKNKHELRTTSQQPLANIKNIGSVSGILYIVFGSIGIGVSGILFFVILIIQMIGNFYFFGGSLIATSLLFVSSFTMLNVGRAKRKRLKRASWYVKLCGNRSYIDIQELVQMTHKKSRYILKDVKKMIHLGIFPDGHLDTQNTCLMLNQNIYKQYLSLENERKLREADEIERKGVAKLTSASLEQDNSQDMAEKDDDIRTELESMASKGQAYIRNLQNLNSEIDEDIISTKLFRLENLLKEIFGRMSSHPEQIPEMQRFMDYYLPTTLKLVKAYRDFDKISVPGEDILSAKSEIEKTLDTINQAFGELLNNLYRDVVFDVTTDAQVLQSMLAREGLTNDMKTDD